jgi:hypothetical protein
MHIKKEARTMKLIKPGTDFNDLQPTDDDKPPKGSVEAEAMQLKDFWAYGPENKYFHLPTNKFWVQTSVKRHFHKKAPDIISKARSMQTKTWMPGRPQVIENAIAGDGGIAWEDGYNAFNSYREPSIKYGDPDKAGKWLELVYTLFGDAGEHLIKCFAHRVQHPDIKINHAALLGSPQGTGKDSLLVPLIYAIGNSNAKEVSPRELLNADFNGFVKSILLRVSEARDMGDKGKYALYEELKTYIAAPPNFLPCNEKYAQKYYVKNVAFVIITTNHKRKGVHIPADDRRHYVLWSDKTKDDFSAQYWDDLYVWYEFGGNENVAAYLKNYDLTDFNAKAPPPKTAAFYEFVDAGRSEEDSEMAAALEELNWPPVLTIEQIKIKANNSFCEWLNERRNSKKIPDKLAKNGYEKLVNQNAKDTRWPTSNGRKFVYGNLEYSKRNRLENVQKL